MDRPILDRRQFEQVEIDHSDANIGVETRRHYPIERAMIYRIGRGIRFLKVDDHQ